MKCLSRKQLDAYVSNKLSLHISNQIDGHLANCWYFQQQLKQYFDQMETNNDLETIEVDTKTMAQEIVAKLSPYPINILKQRKSEIPLEELNGKKGSIGKMKKTTLAVAGLAITVALSTMMSPTFTTFVNGLYTTFNPEITTVFIKDDRIDLGTPDAVQKELQKNLI